MDSRIRLPVPAQPEVPHSESIAAGNTFTRREIRRVVCRLTDQPTSLPVIVFRIIP